MNKFSWQTPVKKKSPEEQKQADNLAIAFGHLMGAPVVTKSEYDKINQEKQDLLKKTKDIVKLQTKLIYTECKLQGFMNYHRQWKPKTRALGLRFQKLNDENVYIDFSEFPKDISENLKEAYNCYVNDFKMSCYIMILRTIEIAVNSLYHKKNPIQYDRDGKPVFINAKVKLNWVKNQNLIGGADYQVAKAFIEARNDSIHDLFVPTEKQLMSAFETVINLVKTLRKKRLKNKAS